VENHLAQVAAKLANYFGADGGKLTWRRYTTNWKITMALDRHFIKLRTISSKCSV
jgi:hypothetical protein